MKAVIEKDRMAFPVWCDPKMAQELCLLTSHRSWTYWTRSYKARSSFSALPTICHKTCVRESPALLGKSLQFPSMQGIHGLSGEKYADAVMKAQEEFASFPIEKHRDTFQMYVDSYSFYVQDPPPAFQMELIDLHWNSELVSGGEGKHNFLRELPPTFPELSRVFTRTMCLLGGAYLRENLLSSMDLLKSTKELAIEAYMFLRTVCVNRESSCSEGKWICISKNC